jgi:hypothetical protein
MQGSICKCEVGGLEREKAVDEKDLLSNIFCPAKKQGTKKFESIWPCGNKDARPERTRMTLAYSKDLALFSTGSLPGIHPMNHYSNSHAAASAQGGKNNGCFGLNSIDTEAFASWLWYSFVWLQFMCSPRQRPPAK